jgi:hypothetical protein
MIEVLVLLTMALTGGLCGYMYADRRDRSRLELELKTKTKSLNDNLDNFAKAYRDFTTKTTEFEIRLSSMEFNIKGVSGETFKKMK